MTVKASLGRSRPSPVVRRARPPCCRGAHHDYIMTITVDITDSVTRARLALNWFTDTRAAAPEGVNRLLLAGSLRVAAEPTGLNQSVTGFGCISSRFS